GNQWEPPASPWYVKAMPIPKRDVAKTKKLLADAGTPQLSFTMTVPNGTEALRAAQVIQAMAGEAGFDIKLQAVEFASSLDLAVKGDFEAYQIGWSGRTDPDGNIYNFISCKAPRPSTPGATATRKSIASSTPHELSAPRTSVSPITEMLPSTRSKTCP